MDYWARITKIPPLISWTALKYLTLKCRIDISHAQADLGYEPRFSLEEGVREVKDWWNQI